MKEIILSTGDKTQVSDEDYDYLKQFNWHVTGGNGTELDKYAARTIIINNKRITKYMHQIIIERMGLIFLTNLQPDHKDRKCLNNQRINLRLVTRTINQHNRNIQNNNTSGCKGVDYVKRRNRWRARLKINNIEIYSELFITLEEAIIGRLKAEQRYKRFITPGEV